MKPRRRDPPGDKLLSGSVGEHDDVVGLPVEELLKTCQPLVDQGCPLICPMSASTLGHRSRISRMNGTRYRLDTSQPARPDSRWGDDA